MRSKTAAAIKPDAPDTRLTHWTALMMAYMAARIQLVVNRRMKLSNFSEVGQILSRKGTSTKMRINPETLKESVLRKPVVRAPNETHRHRMLKTMRTALNEKMLAMPRAKQRIMQITPVLVESH